MKKKWLAGLILCSTALFLIGAGEKDSGRYATWSNTGRRDYAPMPRVVNKMRRYAIPRPEPINNPNHILQNQRNISWPKKDGNGALILQHSSTWPPSHHNTVMHNREVMQNIMQQQQTETLQNHYYWHNSGAVKYCHYYDDQGVHWYGFYHGPTFYWTQNYENRWWWYDPHFQRWVYWYSGFWWWPAPTGVIYAYVDNNYYPYDDANSAVTVVTPEMQPPPMTDPSPTQGNGWTSPDGHYLVQVSGPQNEASLYEKSGTEPVFIKYLGQDVDKVSFSGGIANKPLRILLYFKDGSFALYDENGNSLDAPTAPAATDEPSGMPPPSAPPEPPIPDQ